MRRIYLDHAATTPVHPDVAAAMSEAVREFWGNPSSLHESGRRARQAVDRARMAVARLVGAAHHRDVLFTSGGTEADNLAVLGAVRARRAEGRNHLIVSAVEHHAVLDAAERLAAEGTALTVLPVDSRGLADPDEVRRALRRDTALVSVMLANNEVGTIQPVRAIADAAHEAGAWMHTDAVAAAGQLALDVRALDVDFLTVSSHKIYGPKGVGALYVRPGMRLQPLVHGGGQERAWRPGTENVPGIVGFGRAAELALEFVASGGPARLAELRDRLEAALVSTIERLVVNGPGGAQRLPATLNVVIQGVRSESLIVALDREGVDAAGGSACTSGSVEPSHVLRALGLGAEAASGLRLTVGRGTSEADVDEAAERIAKVAARLRALANSARTRAAAHG